MENKRSISDIAAELAARRFPPPAYQPLEAGMCGACVTAIALMVFAMFARLDLDDLAMATTATVAAGFFAPYFYYRSQERKLSAETFRVMEELREAENAKRTNGRDLLRG